MYASKSNLEIEIRNTNEEHVIEENATCLKGVTLTWKDLSVYTMDRGRRNVCKQLINNGM